MLVILLIMLINVLKVVKSSESLFNKILYESVLNSTLCKRHMQQMNALQFYDASFRIPQSITLGNQDSFGNYHQCLGISQELPGDVIRGKYCVINVLFQNDTTNLPSGFGRTIKINVTENSKESFFVDETSMEKIMEVMGNGNLRTVPGGLSTSLSFNLGLCIPESCTTHDALGQYFDNFNITYYDKFCRLPNDKIISIFDWVAFGIFLVIGTLALLSTSYELFFIFITKKAPEDSNVLLRCFSVYTNVNRFFTFTNTRRVGSIVCLDGIRSISILWIVCGHTFSNTFYTFIINPLNVVEWATSLEALWLLSANLAVDTFLMMSGLLLVYTTTAKMTQRLLLKNIHLYYLHRLLRMFPLLAVAILFQASILHHLSDGPNWNVLESNIQSCRDWWWSALLHAQNYVNASKMCLPHTWYLSVDMQLHIISPLVLYWALGSRRSGWTALSVGFLLSITTATIYCYLNNFTTSNIGMQIDMFYFKKYYVNTLTRAPAFFMGMVIGFLLHTCRQRTITIPKWITVTLWIAASALGSGIIYSYNPSLHLSKFWLNFINAFARPLWALSLGWLVIACTQGYGGPINWFLSLTIWKFISRISYSLYLFHYPLQTMMRASAEVSTYFSVKNLIYLFFSDLTVSMSFATMMCILIDAPFSILQKALLRKGRKTMNKN